MGRGLSKAIADNRTLRIAELHVIRATQHLADAATFLRSVGREQAARAMDNASHEAATAIAGAFSKETPNG